jgi:phosphoribosylglycinamide formyltransferase-1
MKIAVLVSGRGSNLRALLDAERSGAIAPGEICCVVANRPAAPALDVARATGKPAIAIDHTAYADRESFEAAVSKQLAAHGAEAIVLAGFMRVLTPGFVSAWAGRIVNTHPSLLPAFPGVRAPEQAIAHGAKVSGCTIHFVDNTLDGGPIIAQAAVPVLATDDAKSLHERIREQEHRMLPEAVKLLADGKLAIDGRCVRIE